MDTQAFVVEQIKWLKVAYEKELTADTREEIIDAIESITMQAIVSGVFDKPEATDGD